MSKIEWTDATWNPIRGCSRVSSGCDNCYAIREAARMDHPGGAYEGLTTTRTRLDWSGKVVTVPEKLEEPLRWRKPRRVFVNSMSDLFHPAVPEEFIDQVFAVMALCDGSITSVNHVFQILTKRPQRMRQYLARAHSDLLGAINDVAREMTATPDLAVLPTQRHGMVACKWPLPNVHLGVSIEDQATADERVPLLLQTPAAVRWVSAEPLLGPVDLVRAVNKLDWLDPASLEPNGIDWLVAGGESGPKARPCEVRWLQDLRDQCDSSCVPFFMKQFGGNVWTRNDEIADYWPDDTRTDEFWKDRSRAYQGAPAKIILNDRKGGDPAEWPEDLRVREYPA